MERHEVIKGRKYINPSTGTIVKAEGYANRQNFKGYVLCNPSGNYRLRELISFKLSLFEPYREDKNGNYINYNDTLSKAIEVYGYKSQLDMLNEEATELALAVRKFLRSTNVDRFLHVCEEIADVEIMIDQFKIIHSETQKHVARIKQEKIERLHNNLLNEQ